MAVVPYSCNKCGNRFDRLEGMLRDEPALVCECGSTDIKREFGGGFYNRGYDYGDPGEHEMALKNRAEIERNAEKYLSGERSFVQPKGLPPEYAPRVPEHMKKTYY